MFVWYVLGRTEPLMEDLKVTRPAVATYGLRVSAEVPGGRPVSETFPRRCLAGMAFPRRCPATVVQTLATGLSDE
jgi:hypothetical protein